MLDPSHAPVVDFDEIDEWAPALTAALNSLLPESVGGKLAAVSPEYVEDARDLLLSLAPRDAVVDATLTWIRASRIAAYHGSRLTNEEMSSVRAVGLIPLKAEERRYRLERALSAHRRWPEVRGQLESTIEAHGRGEAAGRREGQVHLTLSRVGLRDTFSHYLTHGAEFDQRVAYALLGPDGKELLARDGEATIIQVAVPGALALDAAHPYFGIEDLRARGDLPNIAGQFLEAWSYRLAHAGYQSRRMKVDCGMIFYAAVPAAWIVGFETWAA